MATENDYKHLISRQGRQFFTLEHFALFHHIENHKTDVMMANELTQHLVNMSLEAAPTTPYLMNAILALSALHLASIHGEQQAEYYSILATQLQSRSLILFNEACEELSEATCLPMFFFSNITGVQVLHQTLKGDRDDFPAFLNRFASYLHIRRGVRAIVDDWWPSIRQTLASPLTDQNDKSDKDGSLSHEAYILHKMLDQSDLSAASIQVCRNATEVVQRSFRMYHRIAKASSHRLAAIIAFPVHVGTEFVRILNQPNPEALVILAFYAVLLNWCRDAWIIEDADCFMIQAIADRLQGHWSQWLIFPVSVMNIEDSSD